MTTMTEAEHQLLQSYIRKSTCFLEFGAGESTTFAASVGRIKSIDSVESSQAFINETLMPNPLITKAILDERLDFHVIDIGMTGDWGYPVDSTKMHLWPNYSLSIFRIKSYHDLIFVDGRFRVSCILNSILNSVEACVIMVHDFWDRPEYHPVLAFLDVIERVDTLGVFTKKADVDVKAVQLMIMQYQYLPGDKSFD